MGAKELNFKFYLILSNNFTYSRGVCDCWTMQVWIISNPYYIEFTYIPFNLELHFSIYSSLVIFLVFLDFFDLVILITFSYCFFLVVFAYSFSYISLFILLLVECYCNFDFSLLPLKAIYPPSNFFQHFSKKNLSKIKYLVYKQMNNYILAILFIFSVLDKDLLIDKNKCC